ncbi:MAG: hypothetical protein L3J75_04210 [Methylococcaceae bacterium]|nr:hypothetical protein [Methylococcaceae bacterium]
MNIQTVKLMAFALAFLLCLGGCVSQQPSITHTHIGHVMTGWANTPDKRGLFVTAEKAAKDAQQAAVSATGKDNSLVSIKIDVARVIVGTNSDSTKNDSNKTDLKYGVYNALNGTVNHVTYAATSPDASENIKNSIKTFSTHAQVVLNRCDLIQALGEEILITSSIDEAKLLVGELVKLTDANVNGEDIDGDSVIGTIPAEYGLKQLRTQLQAMIDREIPPYRTVDTWYLFHLVRLPNGDWTFRSSSDGDNNDYTYY